MVRGKVFVAALFVFLSGCVYHPNLQITSSAPAYIEVDGVIVCDQTPCTTRAPIFDNTFICDDINYRHSTIMAYPIDKSQGVTQTKEISARCNDSDKKLYFDMEAMGGLKVMQR